MKKILGFLSLLGLLVMSVTPAFAHLNTSMMEKAEKLISSGVSCENLTDEQLEMIGEYYMEMMHPGRAHELMDQMMCGSDRNCESAMHIYMARMVYCGEYAGMGMMSMGVMPMMYGGGSMMMQTAYYPDSSSAFWNGMHGWMMGSTSHFYWGFAGILYLLLLAGLVVLVYLGIMRLWRNTNHENNANSKK